MSKTTLLTITAALTVASCARGADSPDVAERQPGIAAPLVGPRGMRHFDDLIGVEDMTLSDDVRKACDELVPPGSAVANFHNTADWIKMQLV